MSTTQRRGGRRPLPAEWQRTAKVETSLRPEQRDALGRLAESRGLSTAALLLRLVERELAASASDAPG
jgi:hypothetical protein